MVNYPKSLRFSRNFQTTLKIWPITPQSYSNNYHSNLPLEYSRKFSSELWRIDFKCKSMTCHNKLENSHAFSFLTPKETRKEKHENCSSFFLFGLHIIFLFIFQSFLPTNIFTLSIKLPQVFSFYSPPISNILYERDNF